MTIIPLANPSSVSRAVTPAIAAVDVPRRAALRLAAAAAAATVWSSRYVSVSKGGGERSERGDDDDGLDSLFSTASSKKKKKNTTTTNDQARRRQDRGRRSRHRPTRLGSAVQERGLRRRLELPGPGLPAGGRRWKLRCVLRRCRRHPRARARRRRRRERQGRPKRRQAADRLRAAEGQRLLYLLDRRGRLVPARGRARRSRRGGAGERGGGERGRESFFFFFFFFSFVSSSSSLSICSPHLSPSLSLVLLLSFFSLRN